MLIQDVMRRDPVTATAATRVPELVRMLARHGFRHVPIVEHGKLAGIVSDRDVKQSMASAARAAHGRARERLMEELTAGEIMTGRPVTIGPTEGVEEAARLMATRHISALPVTDDDRLLGIVTETDVLQLFARALGVLEPSSRLEVIGLESGAALSDVVRAVEEVGSRLSSVMTLASPTGEREVVLRLATIDPGPAATELARRGYAVRPPARRMATGGARDDRAIAGGGSAAAMSGPPVERPAYGELRRRLLAERDTLLRFSEASDEEIAGVGAPEPGDISDRAASAAVSSLVARVAGQDRHELEEVAAALERLDTGSYGRCERCREAISPARLRAVPAARLCVACQAQAEAVP